MTTNPYSTQTISGYNASPPPDDGSQTQANKVTWAGIKTKLADTVKTLAESIDSAVLSAFSSLVMTDDASEANVILHTREFLQ